MLVTSCSATSRAKLPRPATTAVGVSALLIVPTAQNRAIVSTAPTYEATVGGQSGRPQAARKPAYTRVGASRPSTSATAASHLPTTSPAAEIGRLSRTSRWRVRHSSAISRLVTIGTETSRTKPRLGNQKRRLASREPSVTMKKVIPVSPRNATDTA